MEFIFWACLAFGLFCLVLTIASIIETLVLFIIYKLDGGKMGLLDYFKLML